MWARAALFLLLSTLARACHPLCTRQCDARVPGPLRGLPQAHLLLYLLHHADRQQHLQAPALLDHGPRVPVRGRALAPMVAIQCDPLAGCSGTCAIQCAEPEADWVCFTPNNCRYPRCQLQCDAPACEGSPSSVNVPIKEAIIGLSAQLAAIPAVVASLSVALLAR